MSAVIYTLPRPRAGTQCPGRGRQAGDIISVDGSPRVEAIDRSWGLW